MSSAWSSPFSDYDTEIFISDMRRRYGANAVIEHETLKWAFLLGNAATDFGQASGALDLDVIARSSDVATAAGPTDVNAAGSGVPGMSTTRPQEPVLGNGGTLPVGTSVLIGGLGVVVLMPLVVARAHLAIESATADQWEAALVADDALAGVQAAFDCAMIRIADARNYKVGVSGHEAVSYGSSRVAVYGPPVTTAAGVVESVLYSGQVTSKDRGWARICPQYFDGGGTYNNVNVPASQLKVSMEIPRSTAWPIRTGTRFRVEVMAPALVAYQGANGAIVCDPATGMPIPANQLPPAQGGSNQRIQPPRRW